MELGGTIGDIEGMPFVEAFRQFQFRVKKENFCVAHVSLVPQVNIMIFTYLCKFFLQMRSIINARIIFAKLYE